MPSPGPPLRCWPLRWLAMPKPHGCSACCVKTFTKLPGAASASPRRTWPRHPARREPSLNPSLALFAAPRATVRLPAIPSHHRDPASLIKANGRDTGKVPMEERAFRAVDPSALGGQHGAHGAGLRSQRARLRSWCPPGISHVPCLALIAF